jgi:hypothetical protein
VIFTWDSMMQRRRIQSLHRTAVTASAV